MFLFGRKKKKQERLDRIYAEMQNIYEAGKKRYDELCLQVESVLDISGKPFECNVVRFASEPYLFPELKSYQCFFVDWEIWRHNDVIYIYRSEVEDYPEEYYEADAPIIAKIPVSNIIHFRVEGSTYVETRISGGKVTQNKHTGRIKQTAINTKNIHHDNRVVKMSVMVGGVVRVLDFEYSSVDVLCALLPEKEHK